MGERVRHDPRAEPDDDERVPATPEPTFVPTPAQSLARAVTAAGAKSFARDDASVRGSLSPSSTGGRATGAPSSREAVTGPASIGPRKEPSGVAVAPSPSVARGAFVTNLDPRIERLASSIDESNWRAVQDQLGTLEESGHLPPTLGLIAAIAHNEVAGEAGSPGANELAIRCVASLFGVTSENPIGRVLAKRLLRRPPRSSLRELAPAWFVAAVIAIVLVGAGIAMWLLAGGDKALAHKFGSLSF
jgi:hypothetical protein